MPETTRHRTALLVPTRNRRADLNRLLKSLEAQTRAPDYILLIDGGEDTVQDLLAAYPALPLHYLRVYPPGLTKQRNAGLEQVPPHMSLVGFLDDDLELFPDALETMNIFWETAPSEVGGASFHIVNNDTTKQSWLRRLFLICHPEGGRVLPSGFNTILFPVEKDTQTQWLCGGATLWRAEIFRTHRFEERYPGYGHFDDLDFSFSLGQRWVFWVLEKAKVYHHAHPFRQDRLKVFGASDAINRYLFVTRFGLSRLAYAWAMVGQVLGTWTSGLVRRDASRRDLAAGTLYGLYLILIGRTDRVNAIDVK